MASAASEPSLLRLITCGSVDDGKSTLIGRLLYDSRAVLDDQLIGLARDSARFGTRGDALDFALLVDGLAAEREQGITIDVAYRFFATPRRAFIIADTPGHEQYTRNMVTGASNAELAIILVDARHGVLTQTRRHSWLVRLLGIRHVVLAVNKMDLVDHDEAVFARIAADYGRFADAVGLPAVTAIPISGVHGDNVVARSANMPWFVGPTLLDHLETVALDSDRDAAKPFALPVQWVNRPAADFRGFAGTVASGRAAVGDAVRVQPDGGTTSVARIVTLDGDLAAAVAGQAVTLTFIDEIDCARGDVVTHADRPFEVTDQFEATLCWLHADALVPGRGYTLKLATQTTTARVQHLKYELEVDSGAHLAAKSLALNGIGVVDLALDRPLVFAPYDAPGAPPDKTLGGFILIDRATNATVAAGLIHFALRRAQNVHPQALDVTRETRARLLGQRPRLLWLTGLSGAGKSTIANLVERRLVARGRHSFLLDGDNLRHGLNRDLGFTEADRIENIRRVGEVARLMTDAGLIVIAAFISPYRADRDLVRALLPEGEFVEIFVDAPLAEAERRDPKGLYAKARRGEIGNFTGIDSPYEAPLAPDLHLDTTRLSAEEAADAIVRLIEP